MNKRVVFWIKVAVLVAVVGVVGWKFWESWQAVAVKQVRVEWRWGGVAVAGFCLSMLNGSLVWRWLAGKMAGRQGDKETGRRGDGLATWRLVGAYTFSQMGKYIPGKVALLLMRIERSGRFGMGAGVCTLSTLLENALYMISGGVAGMVAIAKVAEQMESRAAVLLWAGTVGGMAVMAMACYPPVFYGLVNRLLKRMKKEEVPRSEWLGLGTLVMGVVGFFPCWIFGGVALWASTMAVHGVGLAENWWFVGAFALSVIAGMASLLPGGAVVREAMLLAAVTIALKEAGVGKDEAFVLAAVVAGLQRLFQIVAEVVMGVGGMVVTSGGGAKSEIRNSKTEIPGTK